MRVIAGRFRSRRLKSVPGLAVRPTPDRLRESLFNILTPRLPETVFVDAYAGSGAVGIEALSRGAKHIILIERSPHALEVIRDNLSSLDVQSEVTILRGNALRLLPNNSGDICFIDPPYSSTRDYEACLKVLSQMGCQLVIAQHTSRLQLDDNYGRLRKIRVLKQGDNSLSFFEPAV